MSDSAPVSRQIRVESLWTLLRSLAARLWSTGMDSESLHTAWRSHVEVACDACDARLTEEELTSLLDLPEGLEPTALRLQRLAQGYCPEPGCASRFYRITLAPAEAIEWNALLDGARNSPPSEMEEEAAAARLSLSWRTNKTLRIALALVALVAVLLLRQWYVNGTIPFVTRTFTVAPAAAAPTPGSTTAAPSVEPRTNAPFRIAR